jgi:1-acyl-sn-glycerol-3-phosphate acyltransferase
MEPYIPQLNYVYPDKPDEHMIEVKVVREVTVDQHYPYLDKSFRFRLWRAIVYLTIYTLCFPLTILRFGLKIEGRNNLRKYRKLLKNGAMTVSNHIHLWDFLFTLRAVRYRSMYLPVWKENLRGPDMSLVRAVGGVPIPEDIHSIKCFNQAFDEICIKKKKWIHAFPESAMFWFYHPIRPFKKGVFTMAHRYKLPVLPLAFSYRKPHFPFTLVNLVRSLLGYQKVPMVTARIGEPLLFDETLPRKEAVQKMRTDCHNAIIRLAGIRDNPFPAEGD